MILDSIGVTVAEAACALRVDPWISSEVREVHVEVRPVRHFTIMVKDGQSENGSEVEVLVWISSKNDSEYGLGPAINAFNRYCELLIEELAPILEGKPGVRLNTGARCSSDGGKLVCRLVG